MVLAVGDRPIRKLTVDEVTRMVDLGVPEDIERLELLHGVLVERMTGGEPHERLKHALMYWLVRLLPVEDYAVRIEASFALPDRYSLPEPDLLVTEPPSELRRPTTAFLAIEVSDTTLRTDIGVKLPMYASADVPEYWVVDVNAREVVVHTGPRPDEGRYGSIRRVGTGKLRPSAFEVEPLDVDALFAGLEAG